MYLYVVLEIVLPAAGFFPTKRTVGYLACIFLMANNFVARYTDLHKRKVNDITKHASIVHYISVIRDSFMIMKS